MKCSKCDQGIPNDSEFCHFCGTKVSKENPLVSHDPKINFEVSPSPLNPKTRKAIMLTLVSLLTLTFIVVLVVLFLVPYVNYSHAQELLELGKYDLAYSAFSELGNYSDSQDKLIETRYLQAIDYRNNDEFSVANKIFESLGDYRDSKTLIHYHNYMISNTIASTCTSQGSETSICDGCGSTKITPLNIVAHNYILIKHSKATCTTTGEETYSCSNCDKSYTKTLEMIAHNYVLSKQINSTCTSVGENHYSCSMCNDSYIEKIALKTHNWKDATCTAPKTCTSCRKTEGNALGHSNDVVCAICGVTLFKTLEYSGYGVGNVMNVDLPKGTYNFIITHTGQGLFFVDFNNRSIVIEVGMVSYVHQYTSSGLNDGYFNITNADGRWSIKIEAISN